MSSTLAKNSSWNKGPLKVLNGTKLIRDDHWKNSFRISLESFGSFRGPLLHKPALDMSARPKTSFFFENR